MKSTFLLARLSVVLGPLLSAYSTFASTPDCGTPVGRLPTGPAWTINLSGSHACFSSGTVLQVADVSVPAAPAIVGGVNLPDVIWNTALSGDSVYVVDRRGNLRVVDISTPGTPVELGLFDTPGFASDVAVSGQNALVADFFYGLRVVDTSVPAAPTEIGSVPLPGHPVSIATDGAIAVVASSPYGIRVVDVSTPSSPAEVGWITGDGHDITLEGGYAFTAGDTGLRVIDVSTPAAPFEVGSWEAPPGFYMQSVALSGDFAYLCNQGYNLWKIDISNPANPFQAGIGAVVGSNNIAVAGSYGYLAADDSGLRVIDVGSSPFSEVGFIEVPGEAWSVSPRGGRSGPACRYEPVVLSRALQVRHRHHAPAIPEGLAPDSGTGPAAGWPPVGLRDQFRSGL